MEFGVICRPMKGETVCGDSHLIKRGKHIAVFALADGLGHGRQANEASKTATSYIESNHEMDLALMVEECHNLMRKTRGAVIGISRINLVRESLEFVGIGNVGFKSVSKNRIVPISMNGILGYNVRKIKKFEYRVSEGDIFALFSDGVSYKFDLGEYVRYEPQRAAELILEDWGKKNDDASILVAKYKSWK
jgi:hypothetical protein